MTLMALSADDIPPEPDSSDVPPLRCEHDGCQNTLTYSGRGRRPKFCEEHKKTNTSTGTGTGKRSAWPKGDAVEKNLAKLLNWSAAGITFINPADGKVIAKGGPAVAHEVVEIARQNKSWRPYLEWIAAPGKYGPLTFALAAMLIPVMVNHNLLPQFILPILEMEMAAEGGETG